MDGTRYHNDGDKNNDDDDDDDGRPKESLQKNATPWRSMATKKFIFEAPKFTTKNSLLKGVQSGTSLSMLLIFFHFFLRFLLSFLCGVWANDYKQNSCSRCTQDTATGDRPGWRIEAPRQYKRRQFYHQSTILLHYWFWIGAKAFTARLRERERGENRLNNSFQFVY